MEAPIMLVITIVVARWVVRRLAVPPKLSSRLGMGCIALFLLLLGEFSLVLYLRGMSISDYLASRDPISGTVYYAELGILAVIRTSSTAEESKDFLVKERSDGHRDECRETEISSNAEFR